MFARIKKSGNNQYLQIVQNRRDGKKTVQRVIATLGRIDQMQAKGEVDSLVRSLSRFSEKIMLILSARDNPDILATAKKIGPAIIFERIWKELAIGKIIRDLLKDRKFEFNVERAIFLPSCIACSYPAPIASAIDGKEISALRVLRISRYITCIVRWPFWERNSKIRKTEIHLRPDA